MTQDRTAAEAGPDFTLAACREQGRWDVASLPASAAADLPSLAAALLQLPSEVGTIGLVSVADDFFVLVRTGGTQPRLLLSDASAADEWPLARSVLGRIRGRELDDVDDTDDPEDADLEEEPAGDLGLLDDLGLPAFELSLIVEDVELYPDEMLSRIAARAGFGEQFEAALAVATAPGR